MSNIWRRRWVTLPPGWKLQDVQAALNVIIAFICAASVFVLVRYFWVRAARRVTKREDVPAYALLSLNTIGESLDIVWLLRHEILTRRYRGLLLQCVFVLFLTSCTLLSGFIARFSTRGVDTIVPREIDGSLAARDTQSLLYSSLDVSAVFDDLNAVKFPPTRLVEYWPNPTSNWQYNDEQWSNSSWTMDCSYNESVPIPNTSIATNNCSRDMLNQWPQIGDNYWDWGGLDVYSTYWNYDWVSQSLGDQITDLMLFTHGAYFPDDYQTEYPTFNLTHSMTIRTVYIHMQGVPYNSSADAKCSLLAGPIKSVTYTSASCDLKRNLSGNPDDLYYWGASPDWGELVRQVESYTTYYGGRLRRESSAGHTLTPIPGPELVTMYQAYEATKDTSGSLYYNTTDPSRPKVKRMIDVQLRAAQVSLTALIVCSVMFAIILLGLFNYWLFLLLNMKRLHETPQSKLDWMLQTLRQGNDIDNKKVRHKLRMSIASGQEQADTVPLTNFEGVMKGTTESKDVSKSISSLHVSDIEQGDPHRPISDLSGQTIYSPPPFSPHQIGRGHQGFAVLGRNSDYTVVPTSASPYANPNFDTAYDPGRR